MPALTAPAHIWLDDARREWIDDTNVKVMEVALDHVAYGWSAETIHEQYPHLSLAQIHSALGYYYDHKAEFNERIEQSRKAAAALASETEDSPLRQRLRAAGKL